MCDDGLAARQSRDEAAIWHEGWIAGASRRMSTDNPYHAARLTDTAAPEGRPPTPFDPDDPEEAEFLGIDPPAAPAAGEGVETVEHRAEAEKFLGYSTIWESPDERSIPTMLAALTHAVLSLSPVEPQTSEPEGGGSHGE